MGFGVENKVVSFKQLEVANLTKAFNHGQLVVDDRQLFDLRGRNRSAAWSIWLWQDNHVAYRRGIGVSQRRHDLHWRAACRWRRSETICSTSAARYRNGVSIICDMASYDGCRQCGIPVEKPARKRDCGRNREAACARCAGYGRLQSVRGSSRIIPQWWTNAARSARAQLGLSTEVANVG